MLFHKAPDSARRTLPHLENIPDQALVTSACGSLSLSLCASLGGVVWMVGGVGCVYVPSVGMSTFAIFQFEIQSLAVVSRGQGTHDCLCRPTQTRRTDLTAMAIGQAQNRHVVLLAIPACVFYYPFNFISRGFRNLEPYSSTALSSGTSLWTLP